MKLGKSIQELAMELDRQQNSKRDFIADTRSLSLFSEDGNSELLVDAGEGVERFSVSNHTHRQISTRLGIPAKYYDHMLNKHPDLLDENVNTLFSREYERRMIRTLDGNARAFLSDRYRPLDNFDLAQAVLPILGDVTDMRIESCELTESRMYIKALFPRIQREVTTGDVVQAGVVISNSEIGSGSLKVEPLVFRLVCLNGMIAADYSTRKYHVGRANDGGEAAYEVYRDETLKADDRAFWLKVQDTVRASVDEAKFKIIVDRMQESKEQKITADPMKVVERVQKSFGFSDDERGGVLRHLIEGGDLSAYGLLNAITRQSQDIENYDRATDFERMGGQIISLNPSQWEKIAA